MGKPAPKPESTKHLRELANGAVYDMTTHRIVSAKNITTKITTTERANELQSLRRQRKQEALIAAANNVALQGGSVDGHEFSGDLAFVEAVGEAMTMKALSVNDPKSVDAARWLFSETGISEKEPADERSDDERDILAAIAKHARVYLQANE